MDRLQLIDIQNDTLSIIKSDKNLQKSEYIVFDDKDECPAPENVQVYDTVIEVVNMSTLDATIHFQEKTGNRYCFLVMANRYNPGGGYKRGARAQEETICRRSNLPLCFEKVRYPIPEIGGVYCKNISIIKHGEDKNYELLDKYHTSDGVLVAAYNQPPMSQNKIKEPYRSKTIRKIDTMLENILRQGTVDVILGALGCGAFGNPPDDISTIFSDLLKSAKYRKRFRHIVFAIIDSHRTDNFNMFRMKLA